MASGYDAAVAVGRLLAKEKAFLEPLPELNPADKDLVIARDPKLAKRARVPERLRDAEAPAGDFEPYRPVMTEAEAVAEAARCLNCGCSVTCGICERICSSMAIHLEDDQYEIEKEKCKACGMCAQLCPNRNIEIVTEETEI